MGKTENLDKNLLILIKRKDSACREIGYFSVVKIRLNEWVVSVGQWMSQELGSTPLSLFYEQ